MQTHGPKRIYSPKALEAWFSRLEEDWAPHFTAEQTEAGRRMYRDSEIREIELTATEATIRRRQDKQDVYAVVDWSGPAPLVRCSVDDPSLGAALAVAGLYEIEELIADEIPLLPLVGADPAAPAARRPEASANPSPSARSSVAGGGVHASARAAAVAGPTGDGRRLHLRFLTRDQGLIFTPFWLGPDGSRVVVGAHGEPGSGRNLEERRLLIALAAAARKSRFRFLPETRDYVLNDFRQIPEFVRRTIPEWRKQFSIELTDGARSAGGGAQTITCRAEVRPAEGGGLDLRWIFEAGERLLQPDDVARLQAAGGAAVMVPDVGMVTLPAERAASLARWRRAVSELPPGPLPNYLIFSLFASEFGGLQLAPELEAWRQRVMRPPAAREVAPLLRPYQRRGVEWLAHLCDHGCHGLLADEMGLGKTLQILALLDCRPEADRPGLIVCPASVIPVWRDEIQRHFPSLVALPLKGPRTAAEIDRPCLWVSSYAQLRRQRALLDEVEFGYAILDEAQFIKNPDAKVTQACFAIRARHRIALTGTPLENRQLDLWSLFRFLMPGFLGTREGFESALDGDRERTLGAMRAQVAPFLLRRTKDEVASELPPKVQVDLACPLTETQRIEYARICTEGLAKLGEDLQVALRERSFGVFSLLTRLRQVCCDPTLLPWVREPGAGSGKVNLLTEKLTEIFAGGHKVVIFSQFVALLRRVRSALETTFPQTPLFEITGSTLDRKRPVQSFQDRTGAAAMLVSLKAAGTGITLHAADYVFLLDPWWNPAVEEQAIDRVHRIGQTRTVFVYRMIAPGTIEERIQVLQAGKRELFRQIVDGIPAGLDLGEHFRSLQTLIALADLDDAG